MIFLSCGDFSSSGIQGLKILFGHKNIAPWSFFRFDEEFTSHKETLVFLPLGEHVVCATSNHSTVYIKFSHSYEISQTKAIKA